MNYNHVIIASLSVAASMGWTWGNPIYAVRSPGCLYHHSGCRPSRQRPPKTRAKSGISQVTIRKNRRRAHAAGYKKAFH